MKISSVIFEAFLICAVGAKVLPLKSQNYIKCTKKNSILWPDYSDRNNYFECVGEQHFVKRPCPGKTVFNYHAQQCTWPDDWIEPPSVNQLIVSQSQELKEFVSDFSPSCLVSELHLFLPDPNHPRDYFRCTGIGQSERWSCPVNHVFVFLIQMCIFEEPSTTTLKPIERFPNCTEFELHITMPDPWYAEKFFTCTGIGKFELHECPEGTVFVFMMQMCVLSNEITEPENIPTLELPQIPSVKTFPTIPSTVPEETSTSTYSENETEMEVTTIETTKHEATSTTSRYPYRKVKCIICWRPTCERNEETLKWSDYDEPRNFFQCLSEGVFILKSCPKDFIFDFQTQKCVIKKL
ncbi:CLUMA_CG018815, isoform A [Clunio marinus]|uniref:CLUMA_CG018815, isoform A n=1 Tax=Clunio marinus TaxID=568069 RepID=A0A1J1IZU5_9DIPT|nr:CLUMA_CG018815, isoform A [Clunio marinus]